MTRTDLDARVIVPVTDELGVVVVYIAGRPAYYMLDGEWFEALSIETPETPPGVARHRGAGGAVRVS